MCLSSSSSVKGLHFYFTASTAFYFTASTAFYFTASTATCFTASTAFYFTRKQFLIKNSGFYLMLETRRRKGKPDVSKPNVTTDYNVYEIVISYLDIRCLGISKF